MPLFASSNPVKDDPLGCVGMGAWTAVFELPVQPEMVPLSEAKMKRGAAPPSRKSVDEVFATCPVGFPPFGPGGIVTTRGF